MSFSSDVLSITREDAVATLWLDAAERRNAFGLDFWNDLPRALHTLAADDAVRAVVLAARGPSFTVGLDLKTMGPLLLQPSNGASEAQRRRVLYREVKKMQAAITSVADCPKPVIAAVHGHCIGAGIDLITACDIRLASEDAVFSVRETKMAIVADLGTLQRLPRLIPHGHVAELVYTGKNIDAARARAIGLVNEVYANAEMLHDAAEALAREIALNSPLAVQGSKAVLQAGDDLSAAQALDYVALWNSAFLHSNDLTEAVTAFLEKRTPEFKGE